MKNEILAVAGFKGMGDLINAVPAIAEAARRGHEVLVLVYPGLKALAGLLDFGEHGDQVRFAVLPTSKTLFRFFREMRHWSPHLVWISPHAPAISASRKMIPLFWLLRKTIWRSAILAGASSEPFATMLDLRVPVDRALPYAEREYAGLAMALDWKDSPPPLSPGFRPDVRLEGDAPAFDLVIHPGASAKNKQWPVAHCVSLVRNLSKTLKVTVLGLPAEIDPIRKKLGDAPNVTFVSGSLQDAIRTIGSARMAITMDSSSLHFARMLKVPAIALFGSSDPSNVDMTAGEVIPIMTSGLACQPCRQVTCRFQRIHCMENIEPAVIEAAVLKRLKLLQGA